ncbi:MAG: murein biosynthesis integral membrane protein MurJ [Gammaproteobacteria bacterium]|nr:murein biosynthesis integral membrane protein MurJ [Gammaproteobacteria bacterium]MBQ0838310.1 murein biosynthesis integral membrane protein MurJ [Gammaproteobacteria bacterium]
MGSSAIVGAMTMLSRILGLIRDVVFARVIGADGFADAFFVAFKIPNFLRRLFAEGAFAQAFVPVLTEYRNAGGQAAVKALIDRVAGALGSVLIVLTIVAVIAAPMLAGLFAPGFVGDTAKFQATTDMIRVTFPYLLFISLTGFAGGILNSYDRFAVPAFTPVWLNVCLITAALVAAPWFERPVFALAWGVFAAGIIQMLFQIPFLANIHLLPSPKIDWQYPGVKKILRLMAPAIFGVSVSQINLLLDTVIASFLPTGSVSWLYYSDRLAELPLGVFGVAAATVILPNLSRQHAAKSTQEFNAILDWAIRFVLLIAVPASIALMMLAEPVLAALFYDGSEIDRRDIVMAGFSLRAYALGVVAFMLIKVLAPGYFARQDTKTPVKIGLVAMAANMVMNLVFVLALHHYFSLGHAGLALATSLAAFLNAVLLFRGLRRAGVYRAAKGWGSFAGMLLLANAIMAGVLYLSLAQFGDWFAMGFLTRALSVLGICSLGFIAYTATLLGCGFRLGQLRSPVKQSP